MPGLIVHFGKVTQGTITLGESADAYVDPVRREDTARNHTATHMLHAALRQVLGPHVRQAGSYVGPDRLRFDFTHVQAVTDEEMWQVQFLVNEKIRYNARILKSEDTYTEAIRRGALAFFGDKYGDKVRLIEIANGETFSFEVCGGTHVEQTGEVGCVYVLGESSIGAGMRRIEAVSGRSAEQLVWERFHREDKLARTLNSPITELESRVESLLSEIDELRREREAVERRLSLQSAEGLLEYRQSVDGIEILAATTQASNSDSLRDISDWLRDRMGSGVIVLGAVIEDRPTITISVTPDLVKTGLDARELARDFGKTIGGGGGGRPEMAQAGGRQPEKLEDAIKAAPRLIADRKNGS
jgi:alanyl-tRNA synthetase